MTAAIDLSGASSYLGSIDPAELAEHAFEPLGPEVQVRLRESGVVVAGHNFGYGSAREQAASCLVGAGIQAVVAASFSRVFFRNAINTGLLAVECPAAVAAVRDGDELWADVEGGFIEVGASASRSRRIRRACVGILDAGGLIPYLKQARPPTRGSPHPATVISWGRGPVRGRPSFPARGEGHAAKL